MTKLEEAALAYRVARDETNRTWLVVWSSTNGDDSWRADDDYNAARRALDRAHNALLVAAYGHRKVEA